MLITTPLALEAGSEPAAAPEAACVSKFFVRLLEMCELIETNPCDILLGEGLSNDRLVL